MSDDDEQGKNDTNKDREILTGVFSRAAFALGLIGGYIGMQYITSFDNNPAGMQPAIDAFFDSEFMTQAMCLTTAWLTSQFSQGAGIMIDNTAVGRQVNKLAYNTIKKIQKIINPPRL